MSDFIELAQVQYISLFHKFTVSSIQGASEYIFFAAMSKLLAAVTTYPYQVVRARLQDQNGRHSRAIELGFEEQHSPDQCVPIALVAYEREPP